MLYLGYNCISFIFKVATTTTVVSFFCFVIILCKFLCCFALSSNAFDTKAQIAILTIHSPLNKVLRSSLSELMHTLCNFIPNSV